MPSYTHCHCPYLLQVGIRQGFLGGLVVGITNCAAFCAYALALWYGSTRIVAGSYTGRCFGGCWLPHWGMVLLLPAWKGARRMQNLLLLLATVAMRAA